MNLKKIFIFLTALLVFNDVYANIRLPYIISDRMVLQQKTLCNLWGMADADEEITVRTSWNEEVKTKADASGKWIVQVQTPGYGGPHHIEFFGKNYLRVNDIIMGEVWIASGSSNMDLPLAGWLPNDPVEGSEEAIKNCRHEDIRITVIQQKASFDREDDIYCMWYKCSPEGKDNISAQAYFFAKKIHDELGNIPVGIIMTSWSGSSTECWADLEALKLIPSLKHQISEFERCKPLQSQLNDWVKSHKKIVMGYNWQIPFKGADFYDGDLARLSFNDSQWKTMQLPCYMDNPQGMGNFDGIVWFRRWVKIPEEWTNKKLILSLGPIDDMDVTYVNGIKVGETIEDGKWNFDRKYEVSPSVLRGTELLVAVRVIDGGNGGGICGVRESLCIYPEDGSGEPVSLVGEWKYLPTAECFNGSYYSYNYKVGEYSKRPNVSVTLSMKTISALYNSMIYPIIKFTAAGVIFAQGETNIGRADEYLKLLPVLVQNWRTAAGNPNLHFYYTQITPHGYNDSGSEKIREAQRRCQNLIPYSGMACTLDLGRFASFNASDQKTVAARLAAWALHDIYGKDCETSGPELSGMEILKGKIKVNFTHFGSGLVCKGEKLTNFEVVDSKGTAYAAEAEISGNNSVLVWSPLCKSPKNVRYAYKDWVENITLYNSEGLPASSFTTEKKLTDN